MTGFQLPLQRDIDHLAVALWRAKVWQNERSRKAYRPRPMIPRFIKTQEEHKP